MGLRQRADKSALDNINFVCLFLEGGVNLPTEQCQFARAMPLFASDLFVLVNQSSKQAIALGQLFGQAVLLGLQFLKCPLLALMLKAPASVPISRKVMGLPSGWVAGIGV